MGEEKLRKRVRGCLAKMNFMVYLKADKLCELSKTVKLFLQFYREMKNNVQFI